MNDTSLILLLVVAIAIGWLLGRIDRRKNNPPEQDPPTTSKEYFKGLNYLINEQPDRAIDVFVKALDVNSDTVDTHLALGSIFRRRGETDRAIRIHQNLLARTSLSRSQREHVQLELAQDFLSAGLLDRAEELLRDLIEQGGEYRSRAIRALLKIFEREKEWSRALEMGELLLKAGSDSILSSLAHYCCELVEEAANKDDLVTARQLLKQALQYDKNCVRASLLQGQLEFESENYKDAIKALKRIKNQDPDFVPESLPNLSDCYVQMGQEKELVRYLKGCLDDKPAVSLVLTLADLKFKSEGEAGAIKVIADYLRAHPSIRGLNRLINLQFEKSEGEARENLSILKQLTEQLMERKPIYHCSHCGFSGKSLHWRCPGCNRWGTIKPIRGLEGE